MSPIQRVVVGATAGTALLVLFLNRKRAETLVANGISSFVSGAKEAAFRLALPSEISQWSTQILRASEAYGVSPWVLAGLMYRESSGGNALKPKGPAGTGDFSARTPGKTYKQPDGSLYTVGATGLPEDGGGWGRGLMQIDWGVHHQWCTTHRWDDAQTNLNKAAELFRDNLAFFSRPAGALVPIDSWRLNTGAAYAKVEPWRTRYAGALARFPGAVPPQPDPRPLAGDDLYAAALAAYNAGPSGVLQALALGLPPDAPTAKQDYVTWMMTRVGGWMARFA